MTNPLDRQEAGTHYVRLKMQPIEFATVNGLDPCAFSILKYVTRHRTKNGVQDVRKAQHFRELRNWLGKTWPNPVNFKVSMAAYCTANAFALKPADRDALLALERYLEGSGTEDELAEKLAALINEYLENDDD